MLIDYALCNIPRSRVDGQIFVENARWAIPSESDFKKKVKKLKDSYATPLEWANDLKKKLIGTHSFERVNEIYDRTFESLIQKC